MLTGVGPLPTGRDSDKQPNLLVLVPLLEPTDLLTKGVEVRTRSKIVPVRVPAGLGPESRTEIGFKISHELRDIKIALEALDVVKIWKVPNLELAITGPVPLDGRQRFPTRVQQRGDDNPDRTADPTPTLRG